MECNIPSQCSDYYKSLLDCNSYTMSCVHTCIHTVMFVLSLLLCQQVAIMCDISIILEFKMFLIMVCVRNPP